MDFSLVPAFDADREKRRKRAGEAPGVRPELLELARVEFQARGFSFLPRQPIHSILAGRHASRLRGRGLDFEEIRRYLPGDDVRDIDWRVTARTQKTHVRVYKEERDRPVLLLVDQRSTMFFGSRRATKAVTAAEAAALGAWRALHVGDRAGAIVFGDDDLQVIRPHRSRGQVMRILGAIVQAGSRLGSSPSTAPRPERYNEALERAGRLARHDYLVVSVSDGFGVDADTERLATQLAEHNDLLALFVYDPLERQLPEMGRAVFGQAGAQLEVQTSSQSLRRAYATDFEERSQAIEHMCRQRTIPRIPVCTNRPVAEQVRAHLGYVPRTGTGRRWLP